MPLFEYTVTTHQGERSSGTLVAPDRETAERFLTEKEMVVTQLAQTRQGGSSLFGRLRLGRKSWSAEQLLTFTEQLAAMTAAGLTVKGAIDSMLKEARQPQVVEVLSELLSGLSEGSAFSELLGGHPQIFNSQFVAMVSAGESGGHLPEVLTRLTLMTQRTQELRRKVGAAFYYPAIVLSLSALIVAALLIFAIPRFQEIYEGMGGKLPLITTFFVGLGTFLGRFWWLVLLLLAAVVSTLRRFLRTERGERLRDTLLLRLPILGPLFQRLAIARFARTLGSLQSSGVQLVGGLELVARSVGNHVFADIILRARDEVLEGEPLVASLSHSGWFTEMALSLMAVGEHSGNLDVMLNRLADYYETQVDISLRAMTSLIEPAILVFVGLSLGVVIFAMILPVFKLANLML